MQIPVLNSSTMSALRLPLIAILLLGTVLVGCAGEATPAPVQTQQPPPTDMPAPLPTDRPTPPAATLAPAGTPTQQQYTPPAATPELTPTQPPPPMSTPATTPPPTPVSRTVQTPPTPSPTPVPAPTPTPQPSPTPTPQPTPTPTPQPTPTPTPVSGPSGIRYEIAPGVPGDQVDIIKTGLRMAQDFLDSELGGGIPEAARKGITVKIVATGRGNQEVGGGGACCTAFGETDGVLTMRLFIDVAHPHWDFPANSRPNWTVDADRQKIMIHEYTHIWQHYLVVSQPWNRKGKGGEVWFGRPGC